MSQNAATTYEEFTTQARSYGVEVTACAPGEVAGNIDAALEQPAVGTPLPWPDADLPESVETDPTAADIERAVTGVTPASLAIASYGSVVLRMDEQGSEPVSLFNDRHIAVLHRDDIVPDMTAAFEWFGPELRDSRDSAIVATGPSATADMGALVQGAHGPKQVEVFVVS